MIVPKKRWFRFSLRTLFVAVTAIAVGIGVVFWARSWAAQRRQFLNDAFVSTARSDLHFAPLPLLLLGETGYVEIRIGFAGTFDAPLSAEQKHQVELARRLFPEANVDGAVVVATGDVTSSPELRRSLETRLPGAR